MKGKKKYNKKTTRSIDVYPDKAYDPMKLFRQQMDDENRKNKPRHLEGEDEVVEKNHNYPGDKTSKYDELKKYLKSMNLK